MSRPVNFDAIAAKIFSRRANSSRLRLTRNNYEYVIQRSYSGDFIFLRDLLEDGVCVRSEYICSYEFLGHSFKEQSDISFYRKYHDFDDCAFVNRFSGFC